MSGRRALAAVAVVLIIGAIVYFESRTVDRGPGDSGGADITLESMSAEEKAKRYERAKEITTPDAFVNVARVSIAEELEKGNVVLVDFWTYSCINCQRTIPYLSAWHERYGGSGLTIIGVHTPEFEFEQELTNVQRAVEQFDIEYPVVLDNDYSTWKSYHNRYWPRKYLIDIDGFVVYDHIGEGGYEETEAKIRELLAERAARRGEAAPGTSDLVSDDVRADAPSGGVTPETYFGASRNTALGNIIRGRVGVQEAAVPGTLAQDVTYLGGTWNIHDEYAESVGAGTIVLSYRAKVVNIVASSDAPVRVSVVQDGKKVKAITIEDATLYELVRSDESGVHTLELEISEGGLRAFTFTFG